MTSNDVIAYQAKKLAEMEREINALKQKNAALEAAGDILADALARALGSRDRVFVPKKRGGKVEYKVELTIDNDLLLMRR